MSHSLMQVSEDPVSTLVIYGDIGGVGLFINSVSTLGFGLVGFMVGDRAVFGERGRPEETNPP